ncbi:MAG: ABC transporter ATP-binding protein [Methanomicrobiales archaeon]|nr:ABC transporter ATP-binding protein [Methanomicrobiales archaeon]
MIIKLSLKNLSFGYTSTEILHNMTLDIGDGQIVSIVGPNGSGKSTLIKCIDRILTPKAGSILINRRELTTMDRMELARNVSYVPQNSVRVFPNSVFEVVLMGRRPHLGWRGDSFDEEKVWEVLQLLGIENLALSPFNQISGGQQQKVLIARALAQDTGVILLDEPTSNLDIWHQIDVMEIIRSLMHKQDLTALIAIHDLNMAARYSDAVVMMKRGRIVAAGKPDMVLTTENLSSVYGIQANVRMINDVPYIIPLARIPVKPGIGIQRKNPHHADAIPPG